jgi:hypothetical protein
MAFLKSLGLGKDPYIEWLVAAFGCEATQIEVDGFDGREKRWRWSGRCQGAVLGFPSKGSNKWLGTGYVWLHQAGLDAEAALADHCIKLWRPKAGERCHAGIDDPFWAEQLRASGNPDWPSSMPEEAFELGIALGTFAMTFDSPGDARPILPKLPAIRDIANRFSPAVEGFMLHPAAIALEFTPEKVTQASASADVKAAAGIVELLAS